jgi:16S rRNA G966 N2-methylase RsmD
MKHQQPELDFATASSRTDGPVECLGMTFENDEARRAYFLEKLREKLEDPEFRKTPGFPKASDEDILRLSDPPYYTACPNPFLADFVGEKSKVQGPRSKVGNGGETLDIGRSTLDARGDDYRREPFAVDLSVGKTDALYKAHGYHTKVPHLAIVPSILHYTKPGDLVLDGFCGSGMTGVAAQWCGAAPAEYRRKVEEEWKRNGWGKPEWGARRVILGDLGPAATFIAANYNLPFDIDAFAEAAQRILDEVEEELGWMYRTIPGGDGPVSKVEGPRSKVNPPFGEKWVQVVRHGSLDELRELAQDSRLATIEYTVWSEVFACPECSAEVVFLEEALDKETKRVRDEFPCPHCSAALNKSNLQRSFETRIDSATGQPWKRIRLRPVLINYRIDKTRYEKTPDAADLAIVDRIERLPFPAEVPTNAFPIDEMYHGSRLRPKGFTHVHHLFLSRAAHALAALWRRATAEPDRRLRNMLLFFAEQAIWGMSVLARYVPTHYSQVNQYLNGVFYVASQIVDVSPCYILNGKLRRLVKPFSVRPMSPGSAMITTGDCARIPIADDTVDYIFTDPPFGENIYYADLNFLVESWHRVLTDPTPEAIVDRAKKKGLHQYQELMRRCFQEYYRVLKPGRWMTTVFSNSSNTVWRAIQEALGTAGFVVADVRTLDKKQGSYRQVTSTAVKQDLVISAYKPTEALTERFLLGTVGEGAVWAFVTEHLRNVPVVVTSAPESGSSATSDLGPSTLDLRLEVVAERTPQMLHDRMVAFFVQRGVAVPISSPDFFAGLPQRFPERDGMYFLPDQVAEYDRKRTTVHKLRQLSLFVNDEASAIQWVRQQLARKPQTFQDLQPQFMQQLQAWAKHERTIELKEILEQNFLCYHGAEPIPKQIVSWMRQSSTFRKRIDELIASGQAEETDLGLSTLDLGLAREARDRWYVPDPQREGDLQRLRIRTLLREFEDYKTSPKRKITQFRTEAVRAGFKAAYDTKDYQTIVAVARKLPEKVIQEDEKLLMYYDVAMMRMGDQRL